MSMVYKMCQLVDNKVDKMYVFIGGRVSENKTIDVNALYKSDPSNKIFEDIFVDGEITEIDEIVFVPFEIHLDDTIESIKKKCMLALSSSDTTYSGVYMFAKSFINLNTEAIYQSLTQYGKEELTKLKLIQYLSNIDDVHIEDLPDKETYAYDDIISLGFDSRPKWSVSIPIGQKIVQTQGVYPFTVNPFNTIAFDDYLIDHSSDMLTTTNHDFLMELSPLIDWTIYVCRIEDVLNYMIESKLPEEGAISLYYPYIKQHDIKSKVEYEQKKESFIDETDTLVKNKNWVQNMNNTDMFYDVSDGNLDEKLIINAGIKTARFSLNPDNTYNLPLDIVFKLINSTKYAPLIKYNPSSRQEKIYRLHSNKIATNGRKIPSLNKSTIFRLTKVLARTREVAVYIETGEESMILSFFDNCRIEVFVDLKQEISTIKLNELIKSACNPIISIIAEYLQQSGYQMKLFNDITDKDVAVSGMVYVLKSRLTKNLNFKKIINCFSSIFNVIDDNISKGATLRFKKVANYNEMASIEAFITETIEAGVRRSDIIKRLIDNFKLKDETEAAKVFGNFVERQDLVKQAFRNHKFKIKNNPGFLTTMKLESFKTILVTTVNGINDIGYLETIHRYVTSLLVITQTPSKTIVSSSIITKLCNEEKLTDEKLKDEVVAKAVLTKPLVFTNTLEETKTGKNSMMDFLLDQSDSDDDDDENANDDEDASDVDEKEDGAGEVYSDEHELDANIAGLSLANPNPFSKRLNDREPKLFITNSGQGFSSYSRSCPSNYRRQPVILTQDEKDRIDKEHPDSYENSISYKSSPTSETYHYICPHYWSLKDDTSLSQSEVDSGKYGKVIPIKDKKVPKDASIYSFDTVYQRDDKDKYIGAHPGFMKRSKHPDGKCIPCCFKSWDSPSQVSLREKCQIDNIEQPGKKATMTSKKKKGDVKTLTTKFDEYVKGPEKFPLEHGRIGYIPIKIQMFLQIDSTQCQISDINTNIKKNKPCIVRLGIEKSENQSFVGAIASVYRDILPAHSDTPTISHMKKLLLDALDIDLFTTLQNGNLVGIFADKHSSNEEEDDVLDYSYRLRTATRTEDTDKMKLVKKTARSYENFRRYIESPDSKIDHEYLWDLVCFNNAKLFPKGLNIIIIESKDDDITGNVGVICPTNRYSSNFFDANKQTAIFIKRDNFYEHLVVYSDRDKFHEITRRFGIKQPLLLPELKIFLDMIKKSLNDKCRPLSSKPTKYKFATNIPLNKAMRILKLKKYTITHQLINYTGKTVGIEIKKGHYSGVIPVYPSAPSLDVDYKWIDEYTGQSYNDTLEFLFYVIKDTNSTILAKPVIKVVNKEYIVGIITQTNQFIQINPPIKPPSPDIYGTNLVEVNDTGYTIETDRLSTRSDIDTSRVEHMKRIKTESGFFNTFRNMVRTMLGKYKHNDIRKEIEAIITNESMQYLNKVNEVDKKLRDLISPFVKFVEFEESMINENGRISICMQLPSEKCNDNSHCSKTDDGCILLIPNKNLISDLDNEVMYYGKMSDEIVRYSRIQSFIFEPKSFLSFSDLKYNLNDDEVILLESLLTQDYFDELVPKPENEYANYNTYDTTMPIDSQAYSNIVSKVDTTKEPSCNIQGINKIAGIWALSFQENTREMTFANSPHVCTFNIITTILIDAGNALSNKELRQVLIDEYNDLQDYSRTIMDIMRIQGKSIMVRKIEAGSLTIENAILSKEYYLTPLDIWIIARRLDIPLIMIKSTAFIENDKKLIVCNSVKKEHYYFIKVPGVKNDAAPNYKLIVGNDNKGLINSSTLSKELLKEITTHQDISDDLLLSFISTSDPIRKQPHKKEIVDVAPEVMTGETFKIVRKRCPKGTRKNSASKICEKITDQSHRTSSSKSPTDDKPLSPVKMRIKRCAKGTRRNPVTKICEKIN